MVTLVNGGGSTTRPLAKLWGRGAGTRSVKGGSSKGSYMYILVVIVIFIALKKIVFLFAHLFCCCFFLVSCLDVPIISLAFLVIITVFNYKYFCLLDILLLLLSLINKNTVG